MANAAQYYGIIQMNFCIALVLIHILNYKH